MSKTRMTDTDKGLRALLKRLHDAKGKAAIGILGAKASASHGPVTNYDIGAAHEFGTRTIEARSFLRATVDVKRREIADFAARQAMAVVKGTISPETALARMGIFVEGLVKQRIADGIAPALKPATIAAKGGGKSTPLIDSGQLRASITSEVRT